MTIPFYCLLATMLLIVLTKVPVGIAQAKTEKGYDNKNPRDQQAGLKGWGRRALAAHQNTFEALTVFTPAVLISHYAPPESAGCAAALALTFLGARILYPILYIADVNIIRSIVWGVGFIASIWLGLLPIL